MFHDLPDGEEKLQKLHKVISYNIFPIFLLNIPNIFCSSASVFLVIKSSN